MIRSATVFLSLLIWQASISGVLAQITPDQTLGAERSQVIPTHRSTRQIQGGARRGSSLFHSFSQFNVGTRQQVYFANPAGVQNILTRVTGNAASRISGTLGVNGSANLFLLNPHGIVFGQNARLDVQGAFLATTADRFVFADDLTFGAVHPEAPPLLSVNVPIGLQYGQQPGAISSQAYLAVGSGQSLILAGGAIDLTNSLLEVAYPAGGRIELGSVGGAGTVGLNHQGSAFSLSFPTHLERSDISLQGSGVDVRANSGGNIVMMGRSLNFSAGSQLRAGIAAGLGFKGSRAGDIILNATEAVRLGQVSSVSNVIEAATDRLPAAIGNAGNIEVSAASLSVRQGSQLIDSTLGRGNGGSVIIAADRVEFDGTNSAVLSRSGENFGEEVIRANGNGGDVRITASSLSLRNEAQLSSSTLGRGDGGSVMITADRVELENSNIFSSAGGIRDAGEVIQASGNSGNVQITTGSLVVRQGSQLVSSSFGSGNAGNIWINARDRVQFEGTGSAALSSAGVIDSSGSIIPANGNGGDVRITAGSLSVQRGATLSANTTGRGHAGNVMIQVRDRVEFDQGGARSDTTASGRGGNVQISTESLRVSNGSLLNTSTFGSGNAGSVIIEAGDRVEFDGITTAAASRVGDLSDTGAVIPASGNGGDIRITTGSLLLRHGAQLDASTLDRGNAGNIIINARDRVEFNDAYAYSRAGGTRNGQVIPASGRGGDLRISAGSLSVQNGAKLSAESLGTSDAGNVILNANAVSLDRGTLSTETRSRNGGNIILQQADLLLLVQNSRISTNAGTAAAGGNGGNITLNANLIAASDNANNDITANAFNGRGGAVNITGQLAGLTLLSRDELQSRLGSSAQSLNPERLITNDITAISQNSPTLNGEVSINPPDVDPSRGLVSLPTVVTDAANQISSACPTNAETADRLGTFIVSGRGGLPANPADLLSDDTPIVPWVTPRSERQATTPVSPASRAIVEAQGLGISPTGKPILIAPSTAQAGAPRLFTPCQPKP